MAARIRLKAMSEMPTDSLWLTTLTSAILPALGGTFIGAVGNACHGRRSAQKCGGGGNRAETKCLTHCFSPEVTHGRRRAFAAPAPAATPDVMCCLYRRPLRGGTTDFRSRSAGRGRGGQALWPSPDRGHKLCDSAGKIDVLMCEESGQTAAPQAAGRTVHLMRRPRGPNTSAGP